jgi:hypothetical protein
MKKRFIRFLADVFGVTKEIKNETMIDIGTKMCNDARYCYYNMDKNTITGNALIVYGLSLLEGYYPDVEKVVATINDKGLNLLENKADVTKVTWGIQATAKERNSK